MRERMSSLCPQRPGRNAMLSLLSAASLAIASLAAPTAPIAPDSITISVQTVNGSGCPAGTATVKTAPDRESFTISYDEYRARDGGSANATDLRKNCQINLLVNVPQGFTYAISEIEYKGWARLAPGASAQQNAFYYFSGQSPTQQTNYTINGPFAGFWKNTDVAETLTFAPCDYETNLNINSDLRVRAGTAQGYTNEISMIRSTGSVETIFHFSWKRC
jgi:hypothetical protein